MEVILYILLLLVFLFYFAGTIGKIAAGAKLEADSMSVRHKASVNRRLAAIDTECAIEDVGKANANIKVIESLRLDFNPLTEEVK